jgi:outer membrane lipoprotein-sorting protein
MGAFRLAILLALPVLARAGQPFTFDALMQARQAVKSGNASFTEERSISLLDQPLKSRGTLHFQAPDQLEKHTLAPQDEHLVVTGDQVTYSQGKSKPRRFSLSQSPEMNALLESIRGTLTGDAAALGRFYTIQMQGAEEAWQMLLIPKTPQVQALVDSIRIAGNGAKIRTVDTIEHGGDRTVMTITETGP